MKLRHSENGLRLALLIYAGIATLASAQTLEILANFDGPNGKYPSSQHLAQGLDGSLCGTTTEGGTKQRGTTFRLTLEGALHKVNDFNDANGATPESGVILGSDRDFYGTTDIGGVYGLGTVFKVAPDGVLTTLHSFRDTEGIFPIPELIQGINGHFYGITEASGPGDFGTVFEMNRAGNLRTIHAFTNGTDGRYPQGGLVQDAGGSLYGTTNVGGGPDGKGDGTIFKITSNGVLTTLHTFDSHDGSTPSAALVQGSDGTFYGTTFLGGDWNDGVIFKITADGVFQVLHAFCGHNCGDGANPSGGMIQASDGNLYGVASGGGSHNDGTIFEISPAGTLSTLYNFTGADGQFPTGIFQDTDGRLYGTAGMGGQYGYGTVFRFDLGLKPFVALVRDYGRVGESGAILGQGLTGTTSVSLNGTSASFTVVSDSDIRAMVPAGATSGYFAVTTPSGMLTSKVPFHVIP